MTAARDLDCDTLACDAGEEDLCGYLHRDSDFSQCFTIILARRFEHSSESETAYTEIQRERFPKALAFPARRWEDPNLAWKSRIWSRGA